VRHYNPNSGFFNPEDTQVLYQQTAPVLVTGQTNTYRYTPLWGVGDSKIRRPHVATTRGIFRDVSGPSCVVNDSTPGTYGVVYKAGECAQGSQPGEVVVSVPANADRTWGCIIQTHRTYAPCVMAWHSFGAWTLQYDKTRYDAFGGRMRRLTWGFAWPLAQYIFSAAHISPDAQWGFVRFWPVGNVRLDPIAFKIPPMPAEDHVDRSRFIRKPVQVAAGQAYARVRFGYAEYGTPGTNYYCTERQEDCVTDVAVKPFAFTGSDTLTPAACSSGCTIPVPAISGRVLYYRVERSSNGTTWDSGPIQTMVVE
jgi:hypothetical protein